MNELKQHQSALILILVLVLLKFVFVPWYEWQNQITTSNQLLANKINKSELLIENADEIKASVNMHKTQLDTLSQYFYQADPAEQVKLDIQKKIEAQLTSFGLQRNSIGWQNTYSYPNYPIKKHLLALSFSGETYQAIQFLLELTKDKRIHEFDNFSFNLLRQQKGGLGRVSVTIRVAFFEMTKEV